MADKRKGSKTRLKHVTHEQARKILGNADFELFMKVKACQKAVQDKTLTKATRRRQAIILNETINELELKHQRLAHAYVHRWLAGEDRRTRLQRVLEYDDMADEALLGLRTALERFDPLLGRRLATYAESWMHRTLQQGIAAAVGLTTSANRRVNQLKKTYSILTDQLGRVPSEAEVMTKLEITPVILERIQHSQRSALTCVSLDDPVRNGDDEPQTLGALEADQHAPEDIDTHLYPHYLRTVLEKVMRDAGLNAQERQVIESFYGLNDGQTKNLREVGECLGLTRERIRQVKDRALAKLQAEKILAALSPYLS